MSKQRFSKMALIAITFGCIMTIGKVKAENMIGNQSQNEGILMLPAVKPIKIDGDFSDWDLSGKIWVFADKSVRDRYSVEIAAMWDKDNLYLGAKWKDPTPMFSKIDPDFNPEKGWMCDSWQIRLKTDQTTHLTTWFFTEKAMPVMHVSHSANGSGGKLYKAEPNGTTLGNGVEMAYKKNKEGKGFNQEIKIPWSLIYKQVPEIKAGMKFRMGNELLWGDVTGKTWPEHRYADNMQPGVTSREFYWTNWKAWGDAELMAKGNVEPRRYKSEESLLKGTIPVRVEIPKDAKNFSIVINDENGQRIRNLAGSFDPEEYVLKDKGNSRVVEVLWDGLDDNKKLVKPGKYQVKGLSHQGIDAVYEMCFYNPGTPPWAVPSGKGSWGSDHNDPVRVARAGDFMIVSWPGAEGGSGIIGVGPDGLKQWGEKRGAPFLATDENNVYAVFNDHLHKKPTMYRLDRKTGDYNYFILNDKNRPFEIPLKNITNLANDKVTAFCCGEKNLYIALNDGNLSVLNKNSAELVKNVKIGKISSLTFAGNQLYGVIDNKLWKIDIDGKKTEISLPETGRISDIAIDKNGNILVADMGRDKQIKAFNQQGKLQYTCGKKGGRPIRGKFDEQAMLKVSSVDVDKEGNVWAVENWQNPRRVSVWNPKTGKLVRDYIGNTAYSATGSYLDENPENAYVGSIKMKLDRKNRSFKIEEILWVPDFEKNEGFPLWVHAHWFSNPNFFTARVNGKETRFLYNNGMYAAFHCIYARRNGCWQPAAVLTSVKELKKQIPNLKLDGHGDQEGVFWNDLNKDGAVQLSECTFVPGGIALRTHWGALPGSDLSLYLEDGRKTICFRPVRFMDDGAPVYGPKGMTVLPTKLESETIPLVEENLVLSLGGHPANGGWLRADSLDGKQNKWRYPNPYPQVHGSHRATMPKPGLLIGPLKILGVAKVNDKIGGILMMRGNLGQDFLLTVKDGLYVGTLFQDGRLPKPGLPVNEKDLAGKTMGHFSNGSEPFNGWFGSQNDGKIRMTNGLANQAGMIHEVIGLDSISRFDGPSLTVDQVTIAKADAFNQKQVLEKSATKIYQVAALQQAPSITGKMQEWKTIKPLEIKVEGNPAVGKAKIAYDADNLYLLYEIKDKSPWKNTGKEFSKLFKTGDCVDLKLRVKTGKKSNAVTADDCRILIADFNAKPVAVLMKPIDKSAPANLQVSYSSPVTTKTFDRVEIIKNAKIKLIKKADLYIVEAAIPLQAIGLKPEKDLKIIGDIGFITSDSNGMINTARVYWSNKQTNLVSDLPMEAWLNPDKWGTFKFE